MIRLEPKRIYSLVPIIQGKGNGQGKSRKGKDYQFIRATDRLLLFRSMRGGYLETFRIADIGAFFIIKLVV